MVPISSQTSLDARSAAAAHDTEPPLTLRHIKFTYPTDHFDAESFSGFEDERATYGAPLVSPPSWLKNPIEFIKYALSNSERKSSGLEGITLEHLLELKERKGAFEEARTKEVLLTASWSHLLSQTFLRDAGTGPLVSHLRQLLMGKPVIELGVGDNAATHRSVLRGLFRVSRYQAVDQREEVKTSGATNDDILNYLAKQPTGSSNVIAFGVFNEPLSLTLDARPDFLLPAKRPEAAGRKHVEYEYIRRLARELARVVPPGGVLWGAGLHSQSYESHMRHALLGAGFQFDHRAHGMIENSQATAFGVRDPFFLRRLP